MAIGAGEALIMVAAILFGVGVQIVFFGGLFLWGRWAARRQGGGAWHVATWAPIAALFVSIGAIVFYAFSMASAFSSIEHADASQKAALLAAAISEAMNFTALFIVLAAMLVIVGGVVALVGTIRRPPDPG